MGYLEKLCVYFDEILWVDLDMEISCYFWELSGPSPSLSLSPSPFLFVPLFSSITLFTYLFLILLLLPFHFRLFHFFPFSLCLPSFPPFLPPSLHPFSLFATVYYSS